MSVTFTANIDGNPEITLCNDSGFAVLGFLGFRKEARKREHGISLPAPKLLKKCRRALARLPQGSDLHDRISEIAEVAEFAGKHTVTAS